MATKAVTRVKLYHQYHDNDETGCNNHHHAEHPPGIQQHLRSTTNVVWYEPSTTNVVRWATSFQTTPRPPKHNGGQSSPHKIIRSDRIFEIVWHFHNSHVYLPLSLPIHLTPRCSSRVSRTPRVHLMRTECPARLRHCGYANVQSWSRVQCCRRWEMLSCQLTLHAAQATLTVTTGLVPLEGD